MITCQKIICHQIIPSFHDNEWHLLLHGPFKLALLNLIAIVIAYFIMKGNWGLAGNLTPDCLLEMSPVIGWRWLAVLASLDLWVLGLSELVPRAGCWMLALTFFMCRSHVKLTHQWPFEAHRFHSLSDAQWALRVLTDVFGCPALFIWNVWISFCYCPWAK